MSTIKVEDVTKELENGLKNIFESDRFNELLRTMSLQKNYSFNNMLMIALQKPEATLVMGFKEWMKQGRHVQKGESAIKILAPVITKMDMDVIDPKTNQPKLDEQGKKITSKQDVITGFRLVNVFDVTQTDGKEIPSVRDFINRQLKDDAYMSKLYKDYFNFLEKNSGLDVREDRTDNGVGGYFNRQTNELVISTNENETDTMKFRVLIHEYAHSLLHGKDKEFVEVNRGHKEAQAESVAYVVSNYYGLDTSDVSHGYIATWSQDLTLAKKAIEEIQKVSNVIIDEIDMLQKEKINEFKSGIKHDIENIKDYLTEKHGISKDVFENVEQETILQLLNKNNGIVMTGKLEFSEKNNSYYFRTNRNLLEPFHEIIPDGKLAVLNVLKEQGNIKEDYKSFNEDYMIRKVINGGYAIHEMSTKNVVSKQFSNKVDAEEFHKKVAIGQALLNKHFIKNEIPEKINDAIKEVNKSVSKYVSYHSKQEISFKDEHSETIGWTILKNPQLKTLDDLSKFAKEHQHVNSYRNLNLETVEREPERVIS